jgi:hypothetical protein
VPLRPSLSVFRDSPRCLAGRCIGILSVIVFDEEVKREREERIRLIEGLVLI